MVRATQLLHAYKSDPDIDLNNRGDHSTSTVESQPRVGLIGNQVKTLTESDHAYAELALTQGDTSLEHNAVKSGVNVLRKLDWQSDNAVELTKSVMRLTAPNPSVMTGPGTNTYIVGDAQTGYAVIDPGPNLSSHIERIYEICSGQIQMIVCTHSHPDHSPAAYPLKSLCQKRSNTQPLVMGLSSHPSAKEHSHFKPEVELGDGEVLKLEPRKPNALGDEASDLISHTLRVVHTPGHAANHLCLILEEDGMLFSGDHILNGSTTVVDPPDGHMGDYLNSLQKLLNLALQERIEFIFPAHGYVLGNFWQRVKSAVAVIENLYKHRLQREEKIYRVVHNNPEGNMDDWVRFAYDDVPAAIWPVAKRSLLAHVEHLREQGRIA
jgi:recombination protein RecT